MTINRSDKYTILLADTNFSSFFESFSKTENDYNNENIIVDLSKIETNEAQINSLEKFANIQAEHNQSFAVIVPVFDADAFEEELNVVPTLTEAIDIIDMDEMTRDLGF